MDFGTPETSSSINAMATKATIEGLERKHRCAVVKITKEGTERRSSVWRQPTSPMHHLNENLRRTMQCRYTYPNGKIIEVHQGDILEHPADYLVNSANEELKHGGGLAKAIVDKGGQKIQDDCKRYLHDQGTDKLTPTDVVATGGGNLKCKQVLHVVVPKNRSTPGEHEGETIESRYLR